MTPHTVVEALTAREQQILALIVEGLSYAEISRRVYIEQTTVKWYVQEMYDKLGLESPHRTQSQLVARARELGLMAETPVEIPRNNLPAQATPFIGRAQELADLAQLLDTPPLRLVTILAPGGMGKTRLALEVAERALSSGSKDSSRFPNGVFLVWLAPIQSPEHIVSAIAHAVGFPFMSDEREPKQQILDYLSNKQMLLVMDNFEHVLEGSVLLAEILQAAPGVQIIVTSREKLNLTGETVYTLGGMRCADETLTDCDAVRLFVETARRAVPGFELTDSNSGAVIRICDLVEGMPLAIVLAGAWVEVLSVGEIADEIARSIDFLAAEMRDVPRRQWSIRAVFEPTWKRLDEAERTAFMRFSVFRGGATRKATQTVTGADLKTLQGLANKSLITRSTERHPEGRYAMHELLRQYAESRLEESGEGDAVRDAHSAYYLIALAEREEDIKGRDQLGALNDIASDFENVKAAWYWAVDRKDYDGIDRAMICLGLFCEFQMRPREGVALFRHAREAFAPDTGDEPSPIWGRLLSSFHEDSFIPGSDPIPRLTRSLEIARKSGERFSIAFSLHRLAARTIPSDLARAIELFKEAIARYQTLGENYMVSACLLLIGNAYAYMGDMAQCEAFYQQSMTLSGEIGDRFILVVTLHNLGVLAAFRGNHDLAEQYYREAYDISNEVGFLREEADNLVVLSGIAFEKGDFDQAAALNEEARRIHRDFYGSLERFTGRAVDVALVAENYPEAKCALDADRQWMTQPDALMNWNIGSALVACGLEDYPTARQHLQAALKTAIRLGAIPRTINCLLSAAIIESHTGDPLRAVELLALAFTHPKALTGWMEKWPLLTRLRERLKTDLGEDAYTAAWERGRQMNLDTVVRELLDDPA